MRRFEEFVEIPASLETCYQEWVKTDYYPRFIAYLASQTRSDSPQFQLLREILSAPHMDVKWWDLEPVSESDRSIWWHRNEYDMVDTSGLISFHGVDAKRTMVTLSMTWNHPTEEKRAEFHETPQFNQDVGEIIHDRLARYLKHMMRLIAPVYPVRA